VTSQRSQFAGILYQRKDALEERAAIFIIQRVSLTTLDLDIKLRTKILDHTLIIHRTKNPKTILHHLLWREVIREK